MWDCSHSSVSRHPFDSLSLKSLLFIGQAYTVFNIISTLFQLCVWCPKKVWVPLWALRFSFNSLCLFLVLVIMALPQVFLWVERVEGTCSLPLSPFVFLPYPSHWILSLPKLFALFYCSFMDSSNNTVAKDPLFMFNLKIHIYFQLVVCILEFPLTARKCQWSLRMLLFRFSNWQRPPPLLLEVKW